MKKNEKAANPNTLPSLSFSFDFNSNTIVALPSNSPLISSSSSSINFYPNSKNSINAKNNKSANKSTTISQIENQTPPTKFAATDRYNSTPDNTKGKRNLTPRTQ